MKPFSRPISPIHIEDVPDNSQEVNEDLARSGRVIPFGPATTVIITQDNLRKSLHVEMREYEAEDAHTDWYWKLVSQSCLSHERARMLARAMFMDRDIDWDDADCMLTPYSPWISEYQ